MKYLLMVLLLTTIRAEAKELVSATVDTLAPPPINFTSVKFDVDGKTIELKWNGDKMEYSEYFPKKWDEDPLSSCFGIMMGCLMCLFLLVMSCSGLMAWWMK